MAFAVAMSRKAFSSISRETGCAGLFLGTFCVVDVLLGTVRIFARKSSPSGAVQGQEI
jgi:hypothetical protein